MVDICKIFKTEKGKTALSYNGFSYRYDKKGADDTLYWRCIDNRTCRGRIATDLDYSNPVVRQVHSHFGNPEKITVREVRTKLWERASQETTASPTIYRQETAILANMPAAAAMMPAYANVSTTMQRKKWSMFPPLPRSRNTIVVPPSLQISTTGQQFFLFAGNNNDYMAFATSENLRRLCNAEIIAVDGTFDVVPRLFGQLFTLHYFEGKQKSTMLL
jgi:hypothetical protein